jgi:hypothetical protein
LGDLAEDTGNGVRIYAGNDWGSSDLDPSSSTWMGNPPSYRAQLATFFELDLK